MHALQMHTHGILHQHWLTSGLLCISTVANTWREAASGSQQSMLVHCL